jgi:sterol desaturase/sphingolipid hydroxylase (fatty acid hydroxylase superfamily)
MSTADLLLAATAAVWPLLVIAERVRPARPLPRIAGWPLAGLAAFAAYAAMSWYLPQALPSGFFAHSLVPGERLGIAVGALAGWLVATLLGYAWHRAAHAVPLLWRLFHQLHHAPQRLDALGAAIFHPTEMALYTVLGLVVAGPLLGLDPTAASIAGLVGVFNAVFQHANLATPRWLSWLLQRPEAHSLHHARGVHAGNYSDFPLWDRLFGTYREPEGFAPRAGFDTPETARWPAMLALRDVHAAAADSRPRSG